MKTIKTLSQINKLSGIDLNTVYFSEQLVTNYPIKENGEVLDQVNISSKNTNIIYSPPKDLNQRSKLKLRKTVAERLLKASQKLPKGYKFLISEGYRSLWYQKKIFQEIYINFKKDHPTKSESQLWEMTTKFVADPNLCPPHTTGGAVDLTIVDENNEELDMGCPINSIGSKSYTFSSRINASQRKNRQLLFNLLTKAGFVNLPTEWWHFSYGDQYWAIFNKKPHAKYGSLDQK